VNGGGGYGGYNNPSGIDNDWGDLDPLGRESDNSSGWDGTYDSGSCLCSPLLLDPDGTGLCIDPLTASSQFVKTAVDGLEHRTAWAGEGTGVPVLDLGDDGKITRSAEFAFTEWEPTADSDLEVRSSRARCGSMTIRTLVVS